MSESSTTDTTGAGRASEGRGGRGGRGAPRRGGGRSGYGGRNRGTGPVTPAATFKGSTEKMNGHVFQVFGEQTDPQQFQRTIDMLKEYSAKEQDFPGDIAGFFANLEKPMIAEPADLPETETNRLKVLIFEKAVASYCRRVDQLDSNMKALYAIAWGQCSEAMRSKLMGTGGYEEGDATQDLSWLLKETRGITSNFESQRYIFVGIDEAKTALFSYVQGAHETNATYFQNFKSKVEVLEYYGGSFGHDPALLTNIMAQPGAPTEEDAVLKASRDQALAIAFLKRADPNRYRALWTELENQHSRENGQYPKDLPAAYNYLVMWKSTAPQRQAQAQRPRDVIGMTFAQAGGVAGTDGVLKRNGVTCFTCGKTGHYSDKCPSGTEGGTGTGGSG